MHNVSDLEEFRKGKRGVTYLGKFQGKEAIVKRLNPKAHTDRLFIEARFLRMLEGKGIAPALYSFDDNELVMEYINGELILDYMAAASRTKSVAMLKSILRQCNALDKLMVNKYELTNPYKHIVVRDGKPVQLDFERCKFALKPKNVSQFCQFITKKKMSGILLSKGINIDKDKLMQTVKQYKEDYIKSNFNNILKLIK